MNTLPAPYYDADGITLYHGDCRDILPYLPKVDLVLTDPPYGIGQKYGDAYQDRKVGYWDWFRDMLKLWISKSQMTIFTHRVAAIKEITGWDHIAVWNKPLSMGSRLGNSMILPHWEPIFLFGIYRAGVKSKYLKDVFTFNPEKGGKQQIKDGGYVRGSVNGYGHPVPKPLSLMTELVQGFTADSDIICDPMCGSGTTLVAAKQLGRRAIGVEIELAYVKIAVERLKQRELGI